MNAWRALAAATLICAVVVEAHAGECTWLGVTLGSHHFDSDKDHEQQNWGPHIEYCLGRDDLRVFGGWDRNSRRRDSVYVGLGYTPIELGAVRVGVAGARISGYGAAEVKGNQVDVDDEPIWAAFLVAAIEGRLLGQTLGANLMYAPRSKNNVAVLAWQLKWRWR